MASKALLDRLRECIGILRSASSRWVYELMALWLGLQVMRLNGIVLSRDEVY